MRQIVSLAIMISLCFLVSSAHAQRRGGERGRGNEGRGNEGRGNENRGNEGRGNENRGNLGRGNESRGNAMRGNESRGNEMRGGTNMQGRGEVGRGPTGQPATGAGAAAGNDWGVRSHAGKPNSSPTGAQGAAAGAAAANRNEPQYSGAQGAAAGAAAANRNQPQYSGAQGAAAGAAVANRNQPAMSGAAGAAGYAAVRNNAGHPNMYSQQWYGANPNAWAATGWAAGAIWRPSSWDSLSGFVGYGTAAPISYDYGNNVTAQGGYVIVNGQNVGTTDQYVQQAATIAQAGTSAQTSDTDQWLPIGVFAMVRNEQDHPQLTVQLAINNQGILRGNYTDDVSETVLPIRGSVDKATQRAAWTVGDNTHTVMEAGLNDLTESETPALIHKHGKTDHWLLVRLDPPQ